MFKPCKFECDIYFMMIVVAGYEPPAVVTPSTSNFPSTSDPADKLKKYVCTACFSEFMERDLLREHQVAQHPSIEFHFDRIEVEATFQVPWRLPPTTVGLLNVSSSQLPSHGKHWLDFFIALQIAQVAQPMLFK